MDSPTSRRAAPDAVPPVASGAARTRRVPAWPLSPSHTFVVLLAVLFVMAAAFRCHRLDATGFSEDEVTKLNAVRAYEAGNLGANAEHPMAMKLAMWASFSGAAAWNRVAAAGGRFAVAPETALRLPNALAGAATVIVLFLLARAFFGTAIGLWAALFLAFDVTVTGLNRIGKEDTFFLLFLLLGAWCHEEGRVRHVRDGAPPHRWYAAAGAAFGLMLASKYFLQYLGLWALFGFVAGAETRAASQGEAAPGVHQRASKWFWLAIPATFVVFNPAILLPGTWQYLVDYLGGEHMSHHGAYFAGRVYINTVGATPWGLPWHFYFTYLATKTPLPILAAIVLGIGELVRRRRERGAVLARVFLIFFLLPASLAAGKFARYLLPTIVVLDLVAALGIVRVFDLVRRIPAPGVRGLAATTLGVFVAASLVVTAAGWSAGPSLYQNLVGRALSTPGALFPNDELYDAGVREAVEWIARRAAPGASIASDAPGVVREYLQRFGRPDVEARSLAAAGLATPPTETWLLAQNSHACFESIQVVDQVRRARPPDFTFSVRGTKAVEAFRLPW